MTEYRIFGHTLWHWLKYLAVLCVLGILFDQMERLLLSDDE